MRKVPLLLIVLALFSNARSQSVTVSGECITGTVTLNKTIDVNGKPAYQGTGTVESTSGVTVSVYWIGAPDNVWVIDFDGQPYFVNDCNRVWPPGTGGCGTWTSVTGTTCDGPSALAVAGSGTLPVSLQDFNATVVNSTVQLNWKTTSEINNKGFDVQRSSDGAAWTSIGFVNGAVYASSQQTYSFVDAQPLQGKGFYRLAQVDVDGRKTYSSIISADVTATGSFYTLRNKGTGVYTLNINTPGAINITVMDLGGKALLRKTIRQGMHQVDVSGYGAGVYLLQLAKDNTIITEKIVNQ